MSEGMTKFAKVIALLLTLIGQVIGPYAISLGLGRSFVAC
jgi:hypothetical protein